MRAGSTGSQTILGGDSADFLWGASGNDKFEGRGGGDILDDSLGADTASYAHAAAGVVASLAMPSANSGDANGDSYFSIEHIEGSGHDDTLTGNAAANRLTGGKGKDKLKGKKGKDTFAYRLTGESPAGSANRDEIADFNPGTASSAVDSIDLTAIDANSEVNGNQAFKFWGTKPFTAARQLRINKSGGNIVVQGNTGGTLAPEFEIVLKNRSNTAVITAKDFKL